MRAGKATPMQIDLETGEILEDGTEEELAEWVQLSRATRDRWTPCEPHDDPCPFSRQGAPHRQAALRAGRAQRGEKYPPLPEGGVHERSMP